MTLTTSVDWRFEPMPPLPQPHNHKFDAKVQDLRDKSNDLINYLEQNGAIINKLQIKLYSHNIQDEYRGV